MDIHQSYKEVNRLLNDLDFIDIEHRFLKRILKEYIAGAGLVSNTVVELFKDRLIILGGDSHLLRRDIITCHSQIVLVVENVISISHTEISQNLELCSSRLNILFTDFRDFKAELYNLVSQIFKIEADE